jgi:hypothetical protein
VLCLCFRKSKSDEAVVTWWANLKPSDLPAYLIHNGIAALKDAARSPLALGGAIAACLIGVVGGQRIDAHVMAILRLPSDLSMADLGGGPLSSGSVRWINIGAGLPWLQVILPAVFAFVALGIRRRVFALGCLFSLAIVWSGVAAAHTVFAVAVAQSDVPGAMFTYVSYLAVHVAFVVVAACTLAAWRRADVVLGFVPAFSLTGGVATIGAALPGRTYLADGLSLFAVGVAMAAGLSTALRASGRRERVPSQRRSMATTRPDVFISHAEPDWPVAQELADGLEAAGFATWLYESQGLPGVSYLQQTGTAVEQSRIFLLLLSRTSLDSKQVDSEVVRAHECGKPFVPVLFGISHAEFQQRRPDWRQALGSATSIQIPTAGVPAIIARVVSGLQALGE